jgi:hypothetical protein
MNAKGILAKIAGNQILNLTEIAFGGTSWSLETITSHNSTVPVEEVIPTIRQDGTVSFTITPFLPANVQHALLRTLSTSGATSTFALTFPGASVGTISFTGFVQALSFTTPVDGIMGASVTVQPIDAITDQAAAITSVTVTDTAGPGYITGESLVLSTVFDEVVVVTGTPRISIALESPTVFANYVSGSGTNVLTFSKTFAAPDTADPGEFIVASPIQLNGGTIKDQAGNTATLTFTPPTTSSFTLN